MDAYHNTMTRGAVTQAGGTGYDIATKGPHGATTLACGDAETELHSIHEFEGGREHGYISDSRHSIEGKHGALPILG